jgi:ribonuclease J
MEICTVGGYEEVGKNMTAVKVGEDVFIFDAGLYIPAVVELQEQESQKTYSVKKLRSVGALPDDLVLDKLGWRDKVRAIIISHAHLDHVGGVPYLAHRYPKAEILATPFTMAVLDRILDDEKINITNRKKIIKGDSVYKIKGQTETYKLEFIHTTHSTLQCAFLALHTREGIFFYALDFKLDNHPVIGKPTNYRKLREIGKKGVRVLVADALYSGTERRTPSERIARNLLDDALSNARGKNTALFITTFSSHIARLKSIVDFGSRTNRKIIFMGRSLNKYVNSAIKVNECPFKNKINLVSYKNQVNSMLRKIEKDRGKYLVVCTGHQAEPDSMLDKIVQGATPFKFRKGDNLIFSSSIIPVPINISARERMDKRLKKIGVRIQTDVHVSGHGGREDLRDLLNMLNPKNIIPAHGSTQQLIPMVELAREIGYSAGKACHVMQDGQLLKL